MPVGQRRKAAHVDDRATESTELLRRDGELLWDELEEIHHWVMTAVRGLAELPLLGRTNAQHTAEDSQHTRTPADYLASLTNDVLELSRIETDRITFEPQPFGLGEVLDDVIATLATRVADKRVKLTAVIEPAVPDRLQGDPLCLPQVLSYPIDKPID